MRETTVKKALMLCLVGTIAWAGVADAKRKGNDNIDFGAINCRTFIEDVANGSEDDVGALMLWLDGYLSGVSGDTVLRFDSLEEFGGNLVDHCARRGGDNLLDAAKRVGIE